MVRVICRIKPPLRNNTKIIESDKLLFDKKEKDLKKKFKINSKVIKLDKFYDYDVKNNHIFKNEIENLINQSFYLFLYGHTGSGKTYTLFGNDLNYGLIDYLFQKINYKAKLECIELSNTGCIDIFTKKNVGLLEKNDVIQMFDLSAVEINSFSKYSITISKIKNERKKGTSKFNSESSRTHLIINIYHNNKKYVIVDLAGNERKPEMKKGINYLDTNYINSSLLCLKECFRNSKKPNNFVPYRRSKLTRILRDVFETNVKSLIISTIHSGFDYQNDTSDTLFYVSQFKNDLKKYEGESKKFKSNNKPYADYRKKIKINNIKKLDKIDNIRPNTSPKYTKKSFYFKKNETNTKLKPLNINNFTHKKKYDYKNYKNNKNNYSKKSDEINKYKNDIKKLDEQIKNFNEKLNKLNYNKYDKNYKYDKNDKYDKYDKYDKNNKYDKYDNYDKKFYEDIINKYPKTDNKNLYDPKIYYEDYNKYLDDEENYEDYEDDYTDSNYDKNNYKIINLPLNNFYSKYNDEQSIRIFKAINQIMYTRSVKNYTTMAQSENLDLEQIRSLCLSTMATIEVILSEIRKIN